MTDICFKFLALADLTQPTSRAAWISESSCLLPGQTIFLSLLIAKAVTLRSIRTSFLSVSSQPALVSPLSTPDATKHFSICLTSSPVFWSSLLYMNSSTWAGSGCQSYLLLLSSHCNTSCRHPTKPLSRYHISALVRIAEDVKPATDSQNNQHLCFEEPPRSSTILFQKQLVYGACKWVEICLLEGRHGYGAWTKEKLQNWRGAAAANLIPWQPKCQAKCIRGYSLCPSKDGGYQNHQWVKPKIKSKC